MSNKGTDEMSDNQNQKRELMPPLRFPEFREAGGWRETQLHKIAKPISQRATTGDGNTVLTLSGEDGLLPQNEYFGKQIAGDNVERYIKIARNDFVYNDRTTRLSTYGSIKKLSKCDSGIVSPIYKCFRFYSDENPFFWDRYFESGTHEAQLHGLVNEGARAGRFNISIDQFLSTSVWLPGRHEQQKIADCLSSIEELITAEILKLDALKDHKRGLMQRLFPAEGKATPGLRFREFRGQGEWAARELGEFITERALFAGKNVPLFSLTIEDGVTPKTERYERAFLVKHEKDAYKVMLPDDFAYNPMNLRFGAIGRHSGDLNVAVSKYYSIFSCDKTVDSRFCEIYFKSDRMIAFYDNVAAGSLIEKRRVHFNDFLKFSVRFPLLPEQQKIADCLSCLNQLISAQCRKVNALKVHKKSLMQQLFPIMDEVWG
jgi:type I restriction enzyme, S subunit